MTTIEFSVYDPQTREIVRNGVCSEDALSDQGGHVVQGRFWPHSHYVSPSGVVTEYTDQQAANKARPPRYPAKWSNAAMTWIDIRDLQAAKDQAIEAMRSAREAEICSGVEWDGSVFDSDDVSQTRLLGAVVASQGEAFTPVDWRLADNSWRTLDAQALAGVWSALQLHIRSAFARFAELAAEIDGATTIADVQAVKW